MFVTGYGPDEYNGNTHQTFRLTYQSENRDDVGLLSIAQRYKKSYFIFYDFTI